MAKRLYKNYVNLSNIIIRVSDGTEKGKEHAVLVNSHLDSTLPSPGAADDALSVGVMLECARVLVNTPGWEPTHAIIFCAFTASLPSQPPTKLIDSQCSTMPKNRFKTVLICTLLNTLQPERTSKHRTLLVIVFDASIQRASCD